jgi:hypothetical protein
VSVGGFETVFEELEDEDFFPVNLSQIDIVNDKRKGCGEAGLV